MNQPLRGGRIAFFGGSFDPPHFGHLAVARAARTALELNTVLFAPVGAQPLKPHGSNAAFEDRLAMTRLAVAGDPAFAVSLADAPRPAGTPNYTFETLEKLRTELPPGGTLFCLMGADSLFGLRAWHRADQIPFVAPLIVASRPGQPLNQLQSELPEKLSLQLEREQEKQGVALQTYSISDCSGRRAPFYVLPGLDVEISASAIRAQVNGEDGVAAKLVPVPVAGYIRSRGLYR